MITLRSVIAYKNRQLARVHARAVRDGTARVVPDRGTSWREIDVLMPIEARH
jgi:hypothetical protein